MERMSVTLEVSKLSGWLNADACCRESKAGHTVRGEVRAVRREGSIAGHGKERTLNMACMFVTLDVSKLSGWLNAFACCRVERRACDAGRGTAREA